MRRNEAAQVILTDQVDETFMEARIARIESDVAHMKSDISNIQLDVRELRGDMKAANDAIADVGAGDFEVAVLKVRRSIRAAILTNTISQLLTAGAILGAVGHALKWF